MAARNFNAIGFQFLEKGRANTSCPEATMDAVLIGVFFNEPIDFLHLDNLSFHPGNFRDARCPPPPVRKPLELDNDPYRRRDRTPNATGTHYDISHSHHLLKSF